MRTEPIFRNRVGDLDGVYQDGVEAEISKCKENGGYTADDPD